MEDNSVIKYKYLGQFLTERENTGKKGLVVSLLDFAGKPFYVR
jgi:hypothetical protein